MANGKTNTNTNFDNGVTNNPLSNLLGSYILPDPTVCHTYFNDFDTYTAGNWTITATGSTTQALTNENGGSLLITNSAGNNDLVSLQLVPASFAFTAGVPAFFKARFKLSDANLSGFSIGIQAIDTTPFSVVNGALFSKASGSTALNFGITSASTTQTATNTLTLVNATYVTVGFFYDGENISYFGSTDSRSPAQLGLLVPTSLPSGALTVSISLSNGEAVAKTATVDYILAATQR